MDGGLGRWPSPGAWVSTLRTMRSSRAPLSMKNRGRYQRTPTYSGRYEFSCDVFDAVAFQCKLSNARAAASAISF